MIRMLPICVALLLIEFSNSGLLFGQDNGLIDSDFASIDVKIIQQVMKLEGMPRVAVFAVGNAGGGLDESTISKSQQMTKLLIRKLQQGLKNGGYVVGPTGIMRELENLQKLSHDPSEIDLSDPQTAVDWLAQALPNVFDVALFSKMSENEFSSQLTVLMLTNSGHVTLTGELEKPIGIQEEAVLSPDQARQRLVTVQLYAVENTDSTNTGDAGSTEVNRTLIPLKYRKTSRNSQDGQRWIDYSKEPILAVIPGELEEVISAGRAFLEIQLQHSGKPIRTELVDKEFDAAYDDYGYYVYTLAPNVNRLLACAVSIDGRSTIAGKSESTDEQNYNSLTLSESQSQFQMRKWILPQKGYQLKYNMSESNELVPAVNPDQSPIVERSSVIRNTIVRGFQTDGDSALAFRLRKPALGPAATAGISTAPGLIRISVYAQKLRTDGRRSEVMSPANDDEEKPVQVEAGPKINTKTVVVKVPIYRPPLEEFVILLRTESQVASTKSNIVDFVQAITNQ